MMLAIQPRTLQYNNGKEKAMSVEEIDVLRAKYIREHLPELDE